MDPSSVAAHARSKQGRLKQHNLSSPTLLWLPWSQIFSFEAKQRSASLTYSPCCQRWCHYTTSASFDTVLAYGVCLNLKLSVKSVVVTAFYKRPPVLRGTNLAEFVYWIVKELPPPDIHWKETVAAKSQRPSRSAAVAQICLKTLLSS